MAGGLGRLPIPDSGQQIQWGSNVQQLGRGANKIVLDGGTGNVSIPGDLFVNAGPQLTRYGRINCEDQYHAMILRGDITYSQPNYTVTGGQAVTTFVQFGGTWRFRHVNGSSNILLCEITPDNILYMPGREFRTCHAALMAATSATEAGKSCRLLMYHKAVEPY